MEINAYVQRLLNKVSNKFEVALDKLGNATFSGDEQSIKFLTMALADGKLISPMSTSTAVELEKQWKSAIYGSTVSNVWHMVGEKPVILDTDAGCDEVGEFVGEYVSSETAELSSGCIDGKLYYLVAADGPAVDMQGLVLKWSNEFSLPNGLKAVAAGKWTGLTVQDMIYR